ncbi:hypothetical protein T01_13651 [Trichinella spiralis]|uniref:MULE transposase domain-containing protein n=1 Tax=Trichinella spiralis TaxID=6334 RepID=A0A0V1C035_TRISP|nr:hypothetical protein T01_13651 [Trichinella spiralis]
MKTVPQIYHEEASSASADLETAGQFPTYKSIKTAMHRKRAQKFSKLPPTRQQLEIPPQWRMTKSDRQENLSVLSEHSVWSMDGTFKIVPEWYQQMFTIHVFIADKLVPLVYCLTVHKDLSTYRGSVGGGPSVANNRPDPCTAGDISGDPHTAEGDGSWDANEAATKKKVKMLLATAFLPPHDVFVAVELLGRDATGSIAALFNYFRVEWMPPDRLPMWNVYNVNIRTNNDLEGWHFKMNRLAGKRHLGFYELLQLLIDEQGSTETLIQQVTSGRVTATTHNSGTRTLEQFLRAVAYLVPEAENY